MLLYYSPVGSTQQWAEMLFSCRSVRGARFIVLAALVITCYTTIRWASDHGRVGWCYVSLQTTQPYFGVYTIQRTCYRPESSNDVIVVVITITINISSSSHDAGLYITAASDARALYCFTRKYDCNDEPSSIQLYCVSKNTRDGDDVGHSCSVRLYPL